MKNKNWLSLAFAAVSVLTGAAQAATPLTTVNPSYTLTNLRQVSTFRPMVGGMDFLSDGRLVLAHWGGVRNTGDGANPCCPSGNYGNRQFTGKVYVVSGATGTSPNVSVDTIATGLEDLMGLVVVRDTIYVSGGNRILRLIRNGNSGPVTRVDTVFILPGKPMTLGSTFGTQTTDASKANDSLWPVKGRSEWLYGLIARNDTFYVNPSSMYNASATTQVNPFRGTQLAVTLGNGTTNKRGSYQIRAMGFRHHAGLDWGPDSTIWTVETQGHWIPTNKLIQVKPGAFYGHKHTPAETWDGMTETPAAVFMPQSGTSAATGGSGGKNAGGVLSNSPAQPLFLRSGPYAGQMIMGDMSWGGIQRFFLEKVNGEWQGAAFIWMGGLEGSVYRMKQGPDGDIYLGMNGASGDWSWNAQYYGLQKLHYNGTTTFEMKAVRSRAEGMEIEFTKPVDTTLAKDTANYTFITYFYNPTSDYGGTRSTVPELKKGAIQISSDRKRVYIPVTGLVARTGIQNRIVEITVKPSLKSEVNESVWNGKAFYTMNAISPSLPFSDSGVTAVDRNLARGFLNERLIWTARAGALDVQTPFRGAYSLKLMDTRGAVIASSSGHGSELKSLSITGARGKLVLLQAKGDGVSLSRTVMLP